MAKPSVDDISWKKAHNILWNELNYSVEMYIGKNEETEDFFHRFKKLEINGQPWEVQGVDDISVDGLIVVALKEDYQNSIEEKTGIFFIKSTTIFVYLKYPNASKFKIKVIM